MFRFIKTATHHRSTRKYVIKTKVVSYYTFVGHFYGLTPVSQKPTLNLLNTLSTVVLINNRLVTATIFRKMYARVFKKAAILVSPPPAKAFPQLKVKSEPALL